MTKGSDTWAAVIIVWLLLSWMGMDGGGGYSSGSMVGWIVINAAFSASPVHSVHTYMYVHVDIYLSRYAHIRKLLHNFKIYNKYSIIVQYSLVYVDLKQRRRRWRC